MSYFDITFLGTCACDFSPRLDTDLKSKLDKDARRASCMLVDGKYLIDCGPHVLDSIRILGIDKSKITDIIITHTHDDHFNENSIKAIAEGRKSPLRVWLREGAQPLSIEGVEVRLMTPFERYSLDDAFLTGMVANHDKTATPQHLLIERGEDKIFYGCDGAWLLNDTYYHILNARLSLAVLDCTMGDYEGDYRIGEHNSIPMLRQLLPSLRGTHAIDEKTQIYFSHLAPSLHAPHEETDKIAQAMGARVAYDGLSIRVERK